MTRWQRRKRIIGSGLLALGLFACARRPNPPSAHPEGPRFPNDSWSKSSLALGQEASAFSARAAKVGGGSSWSSEMRTRSADLAAPIPGGEECLSELDALGVHYQALGAKPGIEQLVVIRGPLGNVRYFANGGLPLICNCRLGVALARISPLLRELRITDVRFSGAYVPRTQKNGRPSLHARGLAIDVHEIITPEGSLSVDKHFIRGLGPECPAGAPLLNRLRCELARTSLFRELITPDHNKDHRDHLHLGISPLESKPGAKSAQVSPK